MKLLTALMLMLPVTYTLAEDLPADLALVAEKYHELVLPADQQKEKTLTLTRHQKGDAHALISLIKEELTDQQADPDFTLDEFVVKRDVYGFKLDGFVLKNLFQSGSTSLPFFCEAIRGIASITDGPLGVCREKVSRLWHAIKKSEVDVTYVRITGNWWGQYAEGVLLLRSKIKTDQFLRLGFDLIHEI